MAITIVKVVSVVGIALILSQSVQYMLQQHYRKITLSKILLTFCPLVYYNSFVTSRSGQRVFKRFPPQINTTCEAPSAKFNFFLKEELQQ